MDDPLPDADEYEDEAAFDRWEAREVWRFDLAWETGAPVVWEVHEAVYERDGVYYFVDASDGGVAERLGRFDSDAEAIEAGKRCSRFTDDERAELGARAEAVDEYDVDDDPWPPRRRRC